LWIVLGIALQLALWLAIVFWRHWQNYEALQDRVDGKDVLPQSSDVVRKSVVEGWTGFRPFKVIQKTLEDEAGEICSFYLSPEDGRPLPEFKPGQFLTFKLPVPTQDGKASEIIRCYSLSDAPGKATFRVSIKRVPAPRGTSLPPGRSSSYFHDHVQVGDSLQVRAPAGHFYLEQGTSPVVLIGGGIGLTPMLSMLNWILVDQPDREVWLFYGVRDGFEMAMKSHLQALATQHSNFNLRICFSAPRSADMIDRDFHHKGRVDVALLRTELPLKPYHFYLCGPTPMMETLVPALEEWGVPDARIHFEAFGPASIKRKSSVVPHATTDGAATLTVTFAKSKKQFAWDGNSSSLLAFAEANGVLVNSGCRAGGCGSCQTTLQAGEVAYSQAPDFDPEPGSCLLCVCQPRTDVILEA
jgi:ferredoxin-NADP reductase